MVCSDDLALSILLEPGVKMHDVADGREKHSCGMMPQMNEVTTCVLNYCIYTCQACGSQLPHVSCTPPERRMRVRRRRSAYVDSSSTYAFASRSRSSAALRFRHAAMDAHEPWLSVQLTLVVATSALGFAVCDSSSCRTQK